MTKLHNKIKYFIYSCMGNISLSTQTKNPAVILFISGFLVATNSKGIDMGAYKISLSADQSYQHSALGQGASLRMVKVLPNLDEAGLTLSSTLVQEDYRGYFAFSINGSVSYQKNISILPDSANTKTFVRALAGIGFWTACVAPEQCGGFGPSIGGEIGARQRFGVSTEGNASFRFDWQTGAFGPQKPIYITTLSIGIGI